VYVYDTFPIDIYYFYQWWVVGGTSVSTQALAGIVNVAEVTSGFASSSQDELTYMYARRTNTSDFQDIQVGYCGPYMASSTLVHWDFNEGSAPNSEALPSLLTLRRRKAAVALSCVNVRYSISLTY